MSDLQELYNIDEQLDSALDDDDLEAYGSLVKQREKIVAALDSDSDAVATIEAEKAKAAEGSPAHQLSTTKTNIEIAERNLAAATDGMERAALTAEIQHLTEEAEIMARRLPCADLDGAGAEGVQLEAQSQVESARAELEALGQAKGMSATRQLLEPKIAEADAKASDLFLDVEVRKEAGQARA